MKKLKGLLIVLAAFVWTSAGATVWNIDAVLHGEDGGFGYSGIHDASGPNPMSGPPLGSFTGVVNGFYDDVSGQIDFTLSYYDLLTTALLDLNFTGNMIFDTSGFLSADSILFMTPLSPHIIYDAAAIHYSAGDVCCSGNANLVPGLDPNSFEVSTGLMSLWGAEQFDQVIYQPEPGSEVIFIPIFPSAQGVDLRLQLSAVQTNEPAMLLLLGVGLLGLRFVRRRV